MKSFFTSIILLLATAISLSGQIRLLPAEKKEPGEVIKLDLTKKWMSEAGFYPNDTPAPWLVGNAVTVEGWRLINIHGENLSEIKDRLGLRELEVTVVDAHRALVTDARIGADWLLVNSRSGRLRERVDWRKSFADHFQSWPEADALVGSKWELVQRQDSDERVETRMRRKKIVETMLPGTRIKFGQATVSCLSAEGVELGERVWELIPNAANQPGFDYSLKIFDLVPDTDLHTAIHFFVLKDGEGEITLIAKQFEDQREDGGRGSNFNEKPPKMWAKYRRISDPGGT